MSRCPLCQAKKHPDDATCDRCFRWMTLKTCFREEPTKFFLDANFDAWQACSPDLPPSMKAFNGQGFLVKLPSRPFAPIYTTNLHYLGQVPEHFRGNWPGQLAEIHTVPT